MLIKLLGSLLFASVLALTGCSEEIGPAVMSDEREPGIMSEEMHEEMGPGMMRGEMGPKMMDEEHHEVREEAGHMVEHRSEEMEEMRD